MSIKNQEKRRITIAAGLQRGDKKLIAARAGVHPVWVSYVLSGRGVSDRVLTVAEQVIAERARQN